MFEPALPARDAVAVQPDGAELAAASLRPDPAQSRAAIGERLENGSAAELIASLSEHPRLGELFSKDSRVAERYTIGEHTEMVLRQFDRYLSWQPLPDGVTKGELRLLLALHDIGKPIPANKEDQHRATIEVIESVRELLPISDRALEIGKALIDNDIIGDLVRTCTTKLATMEERKAIGELARSGKMTLRDLQEFAWLVEVEDVHSQHPRHSAFEAKLSAASQWLTDCAGKIGMPPSDLLRLVTLFYQSDTAAYTSDATTASGRRASPGLEFLFRLDGRCAPGTDEPLLVVDPRKGRLAFSYYVEKAIGRLESRVRTAEQATPADTTEASRLMHAVSPERSAALTAAVSNAESELATLKERLEKEAAAARDAIFSRAEPELRKAAEDLQSAERSQRSATREGLSDLAKAAYEGRLGRGTLILAAKSGGSRYGVDKSLVEKELIGEGRFSILRVVPLSEARSLPDDLRSASSFELSSHGLIGASYYHSLLTPHEAIIEDLAKPHWPGAEWRRPAVALVETSGISEREARDLFERANVPGGPDLFEWRRLLGEELFSRILGPGDTIDLGKEGAVQWARVRACLLPTGRWAILTPYVESEHATADEYGEYTIVHCAHRAAGAAPSPDGLAARVSPDGKIAHVAGLDPLTKEEAAFVALAQGGWR